ncbi:MAG TPA: methyltransferase [Caulobacteraceae bacterium]|nr:methyltransferase [Caulobacteraceae bacterium]
MKSKSALIPALGLAATLLGGAALAQVSFAISAAVADAGRPDADKARDPDRKPTQTVALTGMKPGDKVADLLPGGGYYTRIFARVVGPTGKVYAVVPDAPPPNAQRAQAFADAMKAYPNVTIVSGPITAFKPAEKLDVVWTSENYHDLRNPNFGAQNMAAFNKMVFDALRPGGVFYIEDHAAAAGAGDTVTGTLHRIDPATVKKEVEAAGFRLELQSDILANREDPHTAASSDAAIRGKTDKLVMKFRKPR